MDKILGYLDQQKKESQPFFMYYATNLMHQ